MASSVTTAAEYLAALPAERRRAVADVRDVVLANLAPGFEESIQYGMLAYCVPHALYPKGYHVNPKLPLPYVSLASQKNHMALYLMCLATGSALLQWFEAECKKSGKKLDMGKSCLRFKKVDDLALDVVAALLKRVTVEEYVAGYEATLAVPKTRAPQAAVKSAVAKGAAAKGAAAKGAAAPSSSGRTSVKVREGKSKRRTPTAK